MVTGGRAVVEALRVEDVRHIFGIPGVHTLPIYDALYDHPEIAHITVRHEQAASFMADGYARMTKRPGVCLLAAGPGSTNALSGVSEAYLDSIPLVVVAGQIRRYCRGKGALHEVDQFSMFKPVTKWQAKVNSVNQIRRFVHEAFFQVMNGRWRPVYLEFPLDILWEDGESEACERKSPITREVTLPEVRRVAEMLKDAKSPAIIAGGGVVNAGASAELLTLAEMLSAPVAVTIMGKGVIPEDSPWYVGILNDDVSFEILSEADTVLALGCRFSERSTRGWQLPLPSRLIQIDIDPAEIGRNYSVSLGLVCDVKKFLSKLLNEVKNPLSNQDRLSRLKELRRKRDSAFAPKLNSVDFPIKPHRVMKELDGILSDDAVVVSDAGNNAWWSLMFLKSRRGRRFIFPSGNVVVGFGIPTALGVKCAKPEAQVVVITGDGGFMMACQELATAVEYNLNVTVLVMNDGGYGAIRDFQKFNYNGRYIAVDISNPDFSKLARAFGVDGVKVERPSEICETIRDALKSGRTYVIDILIDRDEVGLPGWLIRRFHK